METFDFAPNLETLRHRTGNKWRRHGPDVIPAWVADMDFEVAPVIASAIRSAIDRGDLGYYGDRLGEVAVTFAAWQRAQHGWDPDPEQCLIVDDVIGALRGCIDALCEPGDRIIVQTPVYPPITAAVADSRCQMLDSPLRFDNGTWKPDLDQIQSIAPQAKMLVLCNPQNPTGRVFTEPELRAISTIAEDNDLIVVSDEVWGDLTYEPHRHIPFASLSPAAAARTVTLSGPSKTFNLGGLRLAVAHFGSDPLARRVRTASGPGPGTSNVLAVHATLAAWQQGKPWFNALRRHLAANRLRLGETLTTELTHLDYAQPDATYLGWLGCATLALDCSPAEHLLREHSIALSPGIDFSNATPLWVRLNFATGAQILDTLLERLVHGLAPR